MTGAGRRTLFAAALRSVVTTALLLLVYYRAPLQGHLDDGVLVWLLAGLAALAVALTWQVRQITVSDTPKLRAAETVAIGLPVLLLLYAATYAVLSVHTPAVFTQSLDRTGALYYTMTVFTTVGFGDIAPTTALTRILTMSQMVVGLVVVGVVARLLLGAVEVAERRRGGGSGR